jgi:hypothetical protein
VTTRKSHRKRWKAVEVKVAEILSSLFSDVGHPPVQRIPILGRTGPDITYNGIELIIDVKSRLEVPKSSLSTRGQLLRTGNMIGFCLADMLEMDKLSPLPAEPSIIVSTWLSHMNDWKVEHLPTGIACIILHRPKMPVGDSTVIIYSHERNILWTRITASYQVSALPLPRHAAISVHN